MNDSPIIRGPGAMVVASGDKFVRANRNFLAITCTVGAIAPVRAGLPIVASDEEYSAWHV